MGGEREEEIEGGREGEREREKERERGREGERGRKRERGRESKLRQKAEERCVGFEKNCFWLSSIFIPF